jgi:hypothetical protein
MLLKKIMDLCVCLSAVSHKRDLPIIYLSLSIGNIHRNEMLTPFSCIFKNKKTKNCRVQAAQMCRFGTNGLSKKILETLAMGHKFSWLSFLTKPIRAQM